jgi:hypothetical protein
MINTDNNFVHRTEFCIFIRCGVKLVANKYEIFGSGDPGTRELLDIFAKSGIAYTFVDIRETYPSRTSDPLTFLHSKRLDSVPQVFQATGEYIGDFNGTIRHLDKMRKAA